MKNAMKEEVGITVSAVTPLGKRENSSKIYSFFLNNNLKEHYLKTLAYAVVCLYAFEVRRVMELLTVDDMYTIVDICKENISEAIDSYLNTSPKKMQDDFQKGK
jgi:hypothetical protein